jgi:hypothetical protein
MHSVWTKGLKGKEKEARINEVLAYRNAFDELREILEQNYRKKEADRDYGDGWMQRQIATNEYNAALDSLLKLIDLNQKGK